MKKMTEEELFRILMRGFIHSEGERLFRENERLLQDSEAALPEMLNKRIMELIWGENISGDVKTKG